MGARAGEPCLTYREFVEVRRPNPCSHALVRVFRARYKYYVLSWRDLNEHT